MSEGPVRRDDGEIGKSLGAPPVVLAALSGVFGGALIGRFAEDSPLVAFGGLLIAISGFEIARRKTEFQETNA